MRVNTDDVGCCRGLVGSVLRRDECPHVECCVIFDPSPDPQPPLITGMASTMAQEVRHAVG